MGRPRRTEEEKKSRVEKEKLRKQSWNYKVRENSIKLEEKRKQDRARYHKKKLLEKDPLALLNGNIQLPLTTNLDEQNEEGLGNNKYT